MSAWSSSCTRAAAFSFGLCAGKYREGVIQPDPSAVLAIEPRCEWTDVVACTPLVSFDQGVVHERIHISVTPVRCSAGRLIYAVTVILWLQLSGLIQRMIKRCLLLSLAVLGSERCRAGRRRLAIRHIDKCFYLDPRKLPLQSSGPSQGWPAMTSKRFTELVGCALPIQQAGMGSASPPGLVAAVSNAGGLGMLGTARFGVTVDTLPPLLNAVSDLTDQPFGVNFIVSPLHLNGGPNRPPLDRQLIQIAARSAKVVEFFYGDPDATLVNLVHAEGALVSWQVGSRVEALAAEQAGCDFIVAQGIEAGGHVRGTTGTFTLLDEVLDAVSLPVLAAGGIGTRRAVIAALATGADGVRVGTRFVATPEAGAHPDYVNALIAAGAEDTIHTEAFHIGWPNAPHRVLRSCITAAEAMTTDVVAVSRRLDGTEAPILRFATGVADSSTVGTIGAMSLWAGISVEDVTRVQTAAEVVYELAGEL